MADSGVLSSPLSQNSDFHPKCEDGNLMEESQALVQEAKELLKSDGGDLHLHDLSMRSNLSPETRADYLDQLSDSSSPWSTSSEVGNVQHDLGIRSNIQSKPGALVENQQLSMDGVFRETGDRVMSRRSLQQLAKDDLFAQPPSPYCHGAGRLGSANLNVHRASSVFNSARPGLENYLEDIHQNKGEEATSLFHYINEYKGQEVEIGTILKPFIPNYILAVGAIDEFIKVPRPDKKPDHLGLKVLDESGAKQSDPAVMMLKLCATSDRPNSLLLEVPSIENQKDIPKKVDAWIKSIQDLHSTKTPTHVIYSKVMPSMEKLLQEWSPELEKVFSEIQQPTSNLGVDLTTFVDICCSILDIPVYKSRVESLHVMFSLFIELRNIKGQNSSESCKWANVESHVFS